MHGRSYTFSLMWRVLSRERALHAAVLKGSEMKLPYTILVPRLYSFCTDRNCGQRPPTNPLEVISSGNLMLLNLITDDIQRPGFNACYSTFPAITGIINTSSHAMLHDLIFFTPVFGLHYWSYGSAFLKQLLFYVWDIFMIYNNIRSKIYAVK